MPKEKALLAYFLVYFFIAFAWKSWRTYLKTGVNPIVLPNTDDAYGFVATGFKLILMSILLYLCALVFFDFVESGSGTFQWLEFVGIEIFAWLLMTVGLLTTIKSQHDLSDSWRIGIDNHSKTNLITTGIYKFSRNPIFLSMRLSVFGAFLLVPNGVMLLLLGLSEVFIQVQVRLEETHLKQVHGKYYEIYASKVRRWI